MMMVRNKQSTQRMRRKHSVALLLLLMFAIINLFVSAAAQANSLRDAKSKFSQGDLPATVNILEPELFPKPKLGGKDLESARGLYGITQFILGNKAKAESVFTQMIKANPQAKLDRKYLLDPGAEPFFESLKKKGVGKAASTDDDVKQRSVSVNEKKKASTSQKDAISRRGQSSSARPTPPPEAPRAKPLKEAAPKAGPFTGIKVNVNAPRATLFADGIFIGSPEDKISLDPGKHVISISAEGYETQEKNIKVEKGKTLQMNVNLIKVGSQKQSQPTSQAGKNAATHSSATLGRSGNGKGDGLKPTGPKKSLNFNQDLPGDQGGKRSQRSTADQYFQEPPPQQYSQPAPQYSQPPQQYAPPQPQYQQPYPQPYPQPQYSYPPPAYPAPQYVAPPVYAPPPAYGYPDPYAQPPAYAAPPPPSYGAPNPYEEEDEAGDYEAPSSRSSGGSRSRKKSRKKGNAFIAVLPFGAGQFQNEHYGKAVFFAGAEAGALGYGLYLKFSVIPNALKKFEADRLLEVELSDDEKATNEIPRDEYLKKINSYFQYSLIGAGAVYLVGVIDALANLESGTKRKRAVEWVPTTEKSKFGLAFWPTAEGGVNLKFTLNID